MYMKKIFGDTSVKTRKTLSVVFIILILLSVGRFFFDIHRGPPKEWLEKSFGGVVVSRDHNIFIIKDGKGDQKVFEMATDTKIFFGRQETGEGKILVGVFVLVESDADLKNPSDKYSAKNIRILTHDRNF